MSVVVYFNASYMNIPNKREIENVLSHRYFKLLMLLGVLLWLILKSPITFTASVNDSAVTESRFLEVYYFYLEFFIWILISIPLLYYAFSKANFKSFLADHKFPLLIFVNFFYALFRTFKSLDVTDTGFHFTKAWGMFHGSLTQNVDFLVGTSFVNGLWLCIAGEPNVLWARFGYVIVVTSISIVSFKIFSVYFTRLSEWFIFFVLSLFFIHFNYYLSINYDNLPVLSALTGIWFLLKKEKRWVSYIISGVFLSLTIWLKFNFIFIIVLPGIYGWILFEQEKKWLLQTLYLYAGYIVVLFAGVLLLVAVGHLGTYINYIDKNLVNKESYISEYDQNIKDIIVNEKSFEQPIGSDQDKFFFLTEGQKITSERQNPYYSNDADPHSLKNLFNSYFIGFWQILKMGALFSVLLVIILLLLGKEISVKRYPVLLIISFILYYATYLRLEGADFIFLSALIFPAYIYLVYCLRYNGNLTGPTVLILLLALFSFPGSNISFNVIYRSGTGLLFLAFPLSFMIHRKLKVNNHIFNLNNYVIIFVCAIMFGILKPWGYNNSHRDIADRSLMVEMFKSPQLFGIHTFPQRVKVVDEVLEYFKNEKYERNNTPALFLSWIPIMYYLTETNCMANNPWHGCVVFHKFRKEYDLNSEKFPPIYITFSKVITRNPFWPLEDEVYRKKDTAWIPDLKKFDYIRYWMKDKNYEKTFENGMFEVYKKIDKLRSNKEKID
ncbi:MAG: hypothetical protein HUN04_14300 [Desulfobacter sp.]|nr:MAG: hypothetical protein HUN04_14300 [Desulfobacter sp.]